MKENQHIYVSGKNSRLFIFKFSEVPKKFSNLIFEIAADVKSLIKEETDRDAPLILVFDR